MPRWLDDTFAALAERDFRILWLGTLTSFLAFFMSTVVNSVVAFGLSGTNRAVGAVIFAQGLAMFLFIPLGGAVADRWPKRRVVATGQGVTSAVFAVTAALVAADAIALWHLAAGGFALGVCFAFLGPARLALVTELVDPGRRGNAMALSQIANNASRVGGPAVAGALLAWPAFGPAGAYAVMALLYAAAGLSLVLLPRSRRPALRSPHVLTDVVDGMRYVGGDPRLRVLLLVIVGVVMAGFPYVAVLPGLVENRLGRPAEAIGLLMGVTAVGGLVTSIAVARFADSSHARGIYCAMGLGFGLTLLGMAGAPRYAEALGVCFLLGAASGGFQTLSNAVLLHASEPAYTGRVMSLTMMAFAGFGLMALPVGYLADAVGERGALLAMGALVCVGVTLAWTALVRIEGAAA